MRNVYEKRTKTLWFDENKCKYVDEIDQDTQASSATQFKKRGLKRKVSVENKFPSKIERCYWDDVYIKYGLFLPRPEVKNRVMSRLLNACFAILNIAITFWVIQNCGVIYRINTAFIRTNPHNFSSNSTNICANSKIPSIHQSQMTLQAASFPFLFKLR